MKIDGVFHRRTQYLLYYSRLPNTVQELLEITRDLAFIVFTCFIFIHFVFYVYKCFFLIAVTVMIISL